MTPESDPLDEEEAQAFSSDRRVWKRWQPKRQGSSGLALKAMGILYEADGPLSVDELAARLAAQLDPTERGYLEAWYLRWNQRQRSSRRRAEGCSIESQPSILPPLQRIVRRWITTVFRQRADKGRSVIRDPDGRYRPGPTAPLVRTMSGELLRFTPEERHRLAQADHDTGRTYLATIEWRDLQQRLALTTPDARAQFVMFLLRRLWIGADTDKRPLDERRLNAECQRLLRLADTETIRRAIVQLVVKDLL